MNNSADSIDISLMTVFIIYEIYFVRRALKRKSVDAEKSIQRIQTVVFTYAVTEPWKTKYCYGGIIQLILFIAVLIRANCY